jgi:hypothetical protein
VPDHVVLRSFPNETVALNLDTGQYHGLNPTAGKMVEALVKADDHSQAVGLLAAEYDQSRETVEADLDCLCESLTRRGLLEFDSDHAD